MTDPTLVVVNPAAPRPLALFGVVGSHAYGLNTEQSDVDYMGVCVGPTKPMLGLYPPLDKDCTWTAQTPDMTVHELGKFVRLCLKGNPSVLELLWLPDYVVQSPIGVELVFLREEMLSAHAIRKSYMGFATSQLRKLSEAKHARHLLRLLQQGLELWRSGQITVALPNRDEVFAFGEAAVADPEVAKAKLVLFEDLFNTSKCVLPDRPNVEAVDRWLTKVRRTQMNREIGEEIRTGIERLGASFRKLGDALKETPR